jgi:hypothetical protein
MLWDVWEKDKMLFFRFLWRAGGAAGEIFTYGLSEEGLKGEAFLPGELKEPGQIFNGKCY